jgi:hypothetical protein
MRKHVLIAAAVASMLAEPASIGASAQTAGSIERFPDYGSSINVPPAWQIIGRPKRSDASFIIMKGVSEDLVDICFAHIHDLPSSDVSQEQIDQFQAKMFSGSPAPGQKTPAEEKARLEQALGRDGLPVKVETLGLAKLASHPREYYTFTTSVGADVHLHRFSYVVLLETPQRAITLLCQSTSSDLDKARAEFGQNDSGIASVFESFALL